MRSISFPAVAILVLTGACGAAGNGAAGHDHGAMEAQDLSFGSPGSASEVSQTVEVEALDSLQFDPKSVVVAQGETIKFVVTNTGRLDHEFVLGDAEYQKSHGGSGAMEHSEGNGEFLEPGATAEVIWTFDEGGEVLFACHVNDHYAGGMYGTVAVR